MRWRRRWNEDYYYYHYLIRFLSWQNQRELMRSSLISCLWLSAFNWSEVQTPIRICQTQEAMIIMSCTNLFLGQWKVKRKNVFLVLFVMFNRTCSSCSSNQQVSRRIYQSMGSDHERTQSFWHFSNSCGRSGSCNRSQKRKAGVRGLQNGKEKVCLVNVFFWKVLDDNQLNRDILKKVESNKLVRSCLLVEDFFFPFISFFFSF